MSHALAEVVHAERFTVKVDLDAVVFACPAGDWQRYVSGWGEDIGELLAAARAHIAEAHAVPLSYDTAPLLHNTDAEASTTGRHAAGALMPEPEPAYDESMPLRVCEATGNTVRGPVYPVEKPGEARKFYCRICFAAYRRSVSHLDDPLPLEDAP